MKGAVAMADSSDSDAAAWLERDYRGRVVDDRGVVHAVNGGVTLCGLGLSDTLAPSTGSVVDCDACGDAHADAMEALAD